MVVGCKHCEDREHGSFECPFRLSELERENERLQRELAGITKHTKALANALERAWLYEPTRRLPFDVFNQGKDALAAYREDFPE